jgi:hypothetical protein
MFAVRRESEGRCLPVIQIPALKRGVLPVPIGHSIPELKVLRESANGPSEAIVQLIWFPFRNFHPKTWGLCRPTCRHSFSSATADLVTTASIVARQSIRSCGFMAHLLIVILPRASISWDDRIAARLPQQRKYRLAYHHFGDLYLGDLCRHSRTDNILLQTATLQPTVRPPKRWESKTGCHYFIRIIFFV